MQHALGSAARLPASPTSLLGRERELVEVQVRLLRDDVRLLTLTSAGGSGKTRLAMEAARSLVERFVDGVCFVDLSSLSHPSGVIPAAAGALGIREQSDQPLVECVRRVLAARQHLLVLDNFEHLLAAAPQVVDLLASCPGLKVLATSRAALRVRWEHEVAVWPLALPEAPHLDDLEALARVPSVALFVERARSACPDFEFGPDNAAAVVEICQRLDGLPLALELAAAASRLLPPQSLARRLQARLPALSPGPRDLPARQQTLRGSIAWSYELLNPSEQRLFRRLAVFAAGGRLDQVEQVCREADELDADVLDGLAALVEHSLVRRETLPDGEPWLRMLETIREFALEQLEASGEAEAVRRRHALAYLALAEAAEPELFGARRMAWVTRLAADHDNLHAALNWLLDHQEADLSCRLAGALAWWWYPLGKVSTGRNWAEQALSCAGTDTCSPSVAKALFTAGTLALFVGDDRVARRRLGMWRALRAAAGRRRPGARNYTWASSWARMIRRGVRTAGAGRRGLPPASRRTLDGRSPPGLRGPGARSLGLHPRGARDFFDALAALGMLERSNGRYHNTRETDLFLDPEKPSYLGGLFEMLNARLYGFWGLLTEALRTGQPQNKAKTGGNFFRALFDNPEPGPLRRFLEGMTGANRLVAPLVARQFPWNRYQTFLDVGTAQGNLPVELALTHPHLQGTGLDVPAVRRIFEEYVASFGLADRLRFHAADFFADSLPAADVLVMGLILEDWDLEQKRTLLAKAYAALPEGGALVIYEPMIDDERQANAFALLQSLNMLLELPGGFISTDSEMRGWLREAGFRQTTLCALGGPVYSMVVGIK